MPFIHTTGTDNATALLLQALERHKTPTNRNPQHIMSILTSKAAPSLRDELRLHARWIRDTLVPVLSRNSKLTNSDNVLLRSIFRTLESMDITLDLLRYSRIEKALMVIAASGTSAWPMDAVVSAEELIQKWEDKLGPLKNLRSDLYGPGGRLEGVRKITGSRRGSIYKIDDESKSAWSVNVMDPYKSHAHGSLGFEIGDWWIKPAAAYRDGIIDQTAHPITADENGAYAIVLSGNREVDLKPDGTFLYHAAMDDPGALKLMKTMIGDTEKIVRILRSWKLRSKLAPKAGLRYDGLYRIQSFGIKLLPPDSWHKTFTLSRIFDQAPITTALMFPVSDQLDDWRDYQRSKHVDRGEDFDLLHEILREPTANVNEQSGGENMERADSGYFSRRSSKDSSRVNSILSSMSREHDYAPTRNSSLRNSMLVDDPETQFTLVAEGTPSTPGSERRAAQASAVINNLDGSQNLSGTTITASDRERWTSTTSSLGDDERRARYRWSEANNMRHRNARSDGDDHPRSRWHSEWGVWRSLGGGLDGVEEGELVDWLNRRGSVADSIEEIAPEDGARTSVETARRVGSCVWIGETIPEVEVEGVDEGDFATEKDEIGERGTSADSWVESESGGSSTDTDAVDQGEDDARRRRFGIALE